MTAPEQEVQGEIKTGVLIKDHVWPKHTPIEFIEQPGDELFDALGNKRYIARKKGNQLFAYVIGEQYIHVIR